MKRSVLTGISYLTPIMTLSFCFGCKPEKTTHDNDVKEYRPNILLIVSEDNGPDFGCYGVSEVTTPNIDSLAAAGVLFKEAFVTYSVCSPSRSTIFTGLYPHQNGQIGLATHKYRMYDSIKTLPQYLKEAGYRTGCIGKIHVNPEYAIPFDFHPIRGGNFAKLNLPAYAEYADTFMRMSQEPFFLMVNYPDAHLPMQRQVEGMPARPIDPKDIVQSLPFVGAESPAIRENTANYYNYINRLDEAVEMLISRLRLTGKLENTMIIYLSDHGPQFSRGKGTNYEAGLKVPLIISWPGRMKSPQTRDEMVSTIDLFPTMLESAGIGIPVGLPGFSLLKLIEGEEVTQWREYIFAGGVGSFAPAYFPRRSVRDNRYKLITNLARDRDNPICIFYEQGEGHFSAGTKEHEIKHSPEIIKKAYETWLTGPLYELYDLIDDPYEFDNLAYNAEFKDVFERLKKELFLWQEETNDPFADPIRYIKYQNEVDSVMKNNPGYRRDPEFEWKYPEYF